MLPNKACEDSKETYICPCVLARGTCSTISLFFHIDIARSTPGEQLGGVATVWRRSLGRGETSTLLVFIFWPRANKSKVQLLLALQLIWPTCTSSKETQNIPDMLNSLPKTAKDVRCRWFSQDLVPLLSGHRGNSPVRPLEPSAGSDPPDPPDPEVPRTDPNSSGVPRHLPVVGSHERLGAWDPEHVRS